MTAKNKVPDLQKIFTQTAIEGHRDAQETADGERGGGGHSNVIFLQILSTLHENINRTEYGVCDVSVKVHGGRIVSVCYSRTENQIQKAAAE